MSSQIWAVALVNRINLQQITERKYGASKKVFLKDSRIQGSSHSFFTLFTLRISVGTAQILQVIKHCPGRHGKISALFLGVT